ncbi:hypothetical protein SD78_2290 [Bacillus badius]|nr:hypothetical protein SD78_2290 [Bacillus badius]
MTFWDSLFFLLKNRRTGRSLDHYLQAKKKVHSAISKNLSIKKGGEK